MHACLLSTWNALSQFYQKKRCHQECCKLRCLGSGIYIDCMTLTEEIARESCQLIFNMMVFYCRCLIRLVPLLLSEAVIIIVNPIAYRSNLTHTNSTTAQLWQNLIFENCAQLWLIRSSSMYSTYNDSSTGSATIYFIIDRRDPPAL